MITQIARLPVAEGKAEEFAAAAKVMIAAVRAAEKGRTLVYDLYRSSSDPSLFIMFEVYADEAAMAEHRATPHMAAFGAAIREKGLLAGRLEIERYEPLQP